MRAILAIGLVALVAGLAVQTLRLRQSFAKNQQLEGQIAELRSVGAAADASPDAGNSSDGEDRADCCGCATRSRNCARRLTNYTSFAP